MNVRRNARKQGYAWAESGRSEYDVIAAVDWCTLEIPSTITPEFLARKAAVYERLREAFDDDDELQKFEDASAAYCEGWFDGVLAFYNEAIAPTLRLRPKKRTVSTNDEI
jgi:hypothetical protein